LVVIPSRMALQCKRVIETQPWFSLTLWTTLEVGMFFFAHAASTGFRATPCEVLSFEQKISAGNSAEFAPTGE
jgi:hypothetical protein